MREIKIEPAHCFFERLIRETKDLVHDLSDITSSDMTEDEKKPIWTKTKEKIVFNFGQMNGVARIRWGRDAVFDVMNIDFSGGKIDGLLDELDILEDIVRCIKC
jgi:hypothetical protein